MKKLKKITAMLMTSVMAISMVPANASADGTIPDYEKIKLVKPVINIQTNDENGKPLTDAEFELLNDKNVVVASWKSGAEKDAVLSRGITLVNDLMLNTFEMNFDKICYNHKDLVYAEYSATGAKGEVGNGVPYYDNRLNDKPMTERFYYNDIVNIDAVMWDDSPAVLNVPANTVYILNNSKDSVASFGIGNNRELYKDEFDGNKPTTFYQKAGQYNFDLIVEPGYGVYSGLGSTLKMMVVSDQTTQYIKTKIHLADKYPDLFTEDGKIKLDTFNQNNYGVNEVPRGCSELVSMGKKKTVYADFCVWSGSLIQTPEIDENGDVEFYVLKTKKPNYNFYIDLSCQEGKMLSGDVLIQEKYAVKTPTLDKQGITLDGLSAGKYTIVQKSHGKDMIPSADTVIEVKNIGTIERFVVKNKSKYVATNDPSKDTTQTIEQAEELILSPNIDKRDKELSPFSKLRLKIDTKKKKSKYYVTLSWKQVKEADGYIIYGSKCGKTRSMKKIATITNNKTTKWTQGNRKKGTYYKYIVVAYAGNKVITTSKSAHATTPGGKKGNPIGIKGLPKKTVSVKVGSKYKLKGKVKIKKKYAIHIAELRYESADDSIATVTDKGVIKGAKKGNTCIYVYTQNGICKTVKVKVK